MANYIKTQQSWRKVQKMYKKVSGVWSLESSTASLFNDLCIFGGMQHSLSIISQDNVTGETIQLNVKYDYSLVDLSSGGGYHLQS